VIGGGGDGEAAPTISATNGDEQSLERSILWRQLRPTGHVSWQQQGVRAEQREQVFRHARHPVLLPGDRSVCSEQDQGGVIPVYT